MCIKNKFLIISLLLVVSFPCFSQSINLSVNSVNYLEVNLNEPVSSNPFARSRSPLEIYRIIEKAKNDNSIQGIILNIGNINRSRETLWELRTALENFKTPDENIPEDSGKKIVAFVNNVDMDVYMLASVADKIVMDELGLIILPGYSAGKGYFAQTLEKLGIGVRELRYFEYKSAAESFTRTSLSDADRRQYTDYLDDIFNLTRSTMMSSRNWSQEDFNSLINRNFIHSARSALTNNLIDYIGGFTEVKNAISEIEDNKSVNVMHLYGDTETSLSGSILKYAPPRAGRLFSRPPIVAVVYANGETDMTRGMEIAKIAKIIRDLGNNRRVKSIVVRINSPGGSAQAADVLAESIRYARQRKPVVISMGSVAASGGYWASMTATHVMANPYTMTGSIGVIGNWFYDNGLYKNIGVTTDVIKRGDHSDLMTGFLIPYRNLTNQEEEQYKQYIIDIYDIFIEKVATGRNMTKQEVEDVAQGRIFSGLRALDTGLVDSVGSLYDAVILARSLAEIEEGTGVQYKEYPEQRFRDILMGNFPVMAKIFSFFGRTSQERNSNNQINLELLIPDPHLRYRIENNRQVMPILPLDFCVW